MGKFLLSFFGTYQTKPHNDNYCSKQQGGSPEVSVGKVKDSFSRKERKELPRFLLFISWRKRTGKATFTFRKLRTL